MQRRFPLPFLPRTLPQQPIRRKMLGLPAFVVNRGGEFQWIALKITK